MKTLTKAFLGGAAFVAVGTMGAGAVMADNATLAANVLEQQLNDTLKDIYAKNKPSDNVTIAKSGDIKVTETSPFHYKAAVPSMTIEVKAHDPYSDQDRIVTRTVLNPATYDVTVTDALQTTGAAIANKLGIATDLKMTATLKSSAPVTFTTTVIDDIGDDLVVANGVCESVTGDAVMQSGQYTLNTASDTCKITGNMDDGRTTVSLSSDGAFGVTIANNGADIFAGVDRAELANVKVDAVNSRTGQSEGGLTIEKLSLGDSYDGRQAPNGQGTKLAGLELLPDNFKTHFAVEGLKVQGLLPKGSPTFNFNVGVGMNGALGNDATADFNVGMKIDEVYRLWAAGLNGVPSEAKCQVSFNKLPMKDMNSDVTTLVDEVMDANGRAMNGQQLDQSGFSLGQKLMDAGTGFDLSCKVAEEGSYDLKVTSKNHFENNALVGGGTVEFRGDQSVLQNAFLVADPQTVLELVQMAKPTPDGKGIEWDYTIDANGTVLVNGQPLDGGQNSVPQRPHDDAPFLK